ncbi:MAG: hypothetical protein KC503_06875 [Myxococcales bacterium]|nr:hypothetical protein [Myxococcales bacterium]
MTRRSLRIIAFPLLFTALALLGACGDFEFQRSRSQQNGGGEDSGPIIIVNGGTDSGAWNNNPDTGSNAPDAGATPDSGSTPPPQQQDSGTPPPPPPQQDSGTPPPPTGACGSPEESEVLVIVNQERAKQGLAPLACDLKASAVARKYSEYMCTAGFFSHTGADGSSPWDRLSAGGVDFRGAGENIAAGQTSPASVMNSWMNSSGHRANILGNYTHIGIGYNNCGKGYKHYWTQNFMRR